jgi:hypothetical protein|tara:strand:+ start:697 stop:1521 length:825 start_codon:yes stop_codon:yes gene_type:complete
MINAISLGAGVQSSTMALMAASGEITPMPNCAVFADVGGDEPVEVYEWLKKLKELLPFPVYTVRRDEEKSLSEYDLRVRQSKITQRVYRDGQIPAHILKSNGKVGILHRKCTRDFKIRPVVRFLREFANIKRKEKEVKVKQWMGISVDESHRVTESNYKYVEHIYPLIERDISREDCLRWMQDNFSLTPPRSACVFCPYHSDGEWQRLKMEAPLDFRRAVLHEERMQSASESCEVIQGTPFLHWSGVKLDQVQFNKLDDQMDMFNYECEGMCGV